MRAPRVVDQIRHEHKNMGRVLAELRDRVTSTTPDALTARHLDLLYRMLFYIRVFPNKMHHPKEEDYLFPALLKRAPALKAEVAALRQQHMEGDRALEELEASYKSLQDNPALETLLAFQAQVSSYVDAEFAHMRHEEDVILPAALEALTEADWQAIERAFITNRDPLFSDEVELGFEVLARTLSAD
ncbi:hemerythrin domain-containing protein [Limibacillus sp. MBR-115]|jgi:branched-chain amino acid transport system ATP-binding protein|uniref:hemerythrin domain-containing protein n=1 Tax=Limibacillus sp. MBR-115 TaxID=3156465 RepID=UPI003397F606